MAFQIKNQKTIPIGVPQLFQVVHVQVPARALPQSTTDQLFRVYGGRVMVELLLGEVTTVIQSTDPILKVSSKALDTANVAIGTTYDIASTLDLSSDEVGSMYTVEGDGTALISAQLAGAGYAANGIKWIAPRGEIYLTTGASKTGAMKWDMWYRPLDEGAYVTPVLTATAAI